MNEHIITIFNEHPNQFISGELLSQTLKCSRTAIWKHIQRLKEQGYDFEAVPRLGYRLKQKPSRLDVATIANRLSSGIMGNNFRYLQEVESTQKTAHELAAQGAAEGTLVIAEKQSAGRGRMGRKWHSPPGKGIWMSLILRPQIPLPYTPQLTLLVSVALCRAIKMSTNVQAGIKWPNDLLVEGKKVSGILLESSAEDERLRYVITGVGISVNLEKEDYPVELRDIATSLLIESGRKISREELLCTFLHELEHLYSLFREQGFAPIRLLWEALSISLQRPIRVNTMTGRIEGTALAIDELGALIVLLPSGEQIKVYSGDVQFP